MTLCKAIKSDGKRCKNFVGKGKRDYCARHSGNTRKTRKTRKRTPVKSNIRPRSRQVLREARRKYQRGG